MKQIVKVHSAAEEAKRAIGRKYQSDDGEAVPEDRKLAFEQSDDKLIHQYTNKICLQQKYRTGLNSTDEDDE